jgi:hypothetical protein
MANWFKEEIDHVGTRLETAIEKAGAEIQQQRSLTRKDMEELISLATKQLGAMLDERIEKAKKETADLVSVKLIEFKSQLNEAADNQKKTAIRNAIVGVVAATSVSAISLLSKKYFAGEVNAIDIYRTLMFAIAAGYFAAMVFRLVRKYFLTPQIAKNAIIVGSSYFEILKPKRLGLHVAVFVLALLGWLVLNQSEFIINLLNTLHT